MHSLPGDSLGIGLFQEGAPELMSIRGVEVNQLVVHSGQQVVYPHLLPLAVLPELARGGDRGRSSSTQSTRRMRQHANAFICGQPTLKVKQPLYPSWKFCPRGTTLSSRERFTERDAMAESNQQSSKDSRHEIQTAEGK